MTGTNSYLAFPEEKSQSVQHLCKRLAGHFLAHRWLLELRVSEVFIAASLGGHKACEGGGRPWNRCGCSRSL